MENPHQGNTSRERRKERKGEKLKRALKRRGRVEESRNENEGFNLFVYFALIPSPSPSFSSLFVLLYF